MMPCGSSPLIGSSNTKNLGFPTRAIAIPNRCLIPKLKFFAFFLPVSSHILDELSRLATHYGFIDNGKMIKEISADDLENSFRKSIRIEVTDGKALAAVLKQTGQPYKMPAPNVAEIYHRLNISQLTSALEKYHCDLLSIQEQEENLESYYVDLIGGVSHE